QTATDRRRSGPAHRPHPRSGTAEHQGTRRADHAMTAPEFCRIASDVRLGAGVVLHAFVNLYGCTIGDETKIGTFVEVQKTAVIGRRCKIGSHSFICDGVTIEDECFIGHGVMFINDRVPRATRADGSLQGGDDWRVIPTWVRRGTSIGSGAVILCGLTI